MSSRRTRQGLTLIEALLAVAILGVAITGLIAAASRCLAVARKAKNYEAARRLMGQIELTDPLNTEEIEEGTQTEPFPAPYQNYTWTRTIEPVGLKEDGLYKITLQVNWSNQGQENHETTVSYLYFPEETEGGTTTQ